VPTVGNNTTVNVTANCIDTDGGINAYVAGYAYVYSSGGVYSAVYDSCYSTTTLKEAYCSSNIPVSGLLTCGANYTCLVNRCVGVNTASATGSGGSSTAPKSTAG
jgi:hypothetical protein